MEQIFQVQGMTCGHCERAVMNAIHQVDSTAQVNIDRSINQVMVQSEASADVLRRAIEEEGYQVAQ